MGAVIDLSTPRSRERSLRELVQIRCARRGLAPDADLTRRAMCFALDCMELNYDSAAYSLVRTEHWLDVMVGPRPKRSRRPEHPEPPRAA